MNDGALFGPKPVFDRWVAAQLALLLVMTGALLAGAGWHGGFRGAQALSGQLPPLLWECLTTLGDERVLLALMLPFTLRHPRVFWSVVLAALLTALIARGFKWGLPMPRPAAVLPPDQITVIGWRLKGLSFPSGHTGSAFAYATVWFACLGWRRGWPLIAVAAIAGFSRIAVGAHWPIDVLGGAVFGTCGAWLGLRLAARWRWGLRPGPHWGLAVVAAIAVATLPFEAQGYPGSLPWRIAVALWGLGGFAAAYLVPLLRGGWKAAGAPLAGVADTKA
jgi:membrane-associated phospholipid phosphatase